MKKIEIKEQKKIMLNILKYFDEICRKNNIKYSLIGGSLIGAVRNHGIIPWDDDIDVILDKSNYEKIKNILLNNSNNQYKLLCNEYQDDYHNANLKLVDLRTIAIEDLFKKMPTDYGIFIDIFCYNNAPDDEKERIKHIKKIKFYNKLLVEKKLYFRQMGLFRTIKRIVLNTISKIFYKRIEKIVSKENNKYNNFNTKYVVSNWPIYHIENEVQKKEDILEYQEIKFEDMTAMIFKNYDSILKTTFGDYMKLPPIEKRTKHGIKAYWRE